MKTGMFIMGTRNGTYGDVLDQVVQAEALGYDAAVIGERHFSHSDLLYPSPMSMAAAIAGATSRIRIGLAGRILPLDHPIHVAEDAATIDILSDGRLDFGVTRASLDEACHHVFDSPIDESRGRFEESLEIIVRAWTEPHFAHEGRFFTIPDVCVMPKPVQQPHPPIYVVAVSPDTLDAAARGGHSAILGAIYPPDALHAKVRAYWDAFDGAGHERGRAGLAINRFIYVAETDEQACREIESPFMEFVDAHAPDLKAALASRYGGAERFGFRRFLDDFCLFGSPETVASRLDELSGLIDMSYLLGTFNFVTVEHARCVRSMELFATEVMPAVSGDERRRVG